MDPAVFLDRDGVIIQNNPAYVRTKEDVFFYPQSLYALALLKVTKYKVFVITNQSAIGRGLLPIEKAHQINKMIIEQVEQGGGRIDGVFMCPHSPSDQCNCRKPKPGLILQAAEAYSLDLKRSIMIGDALSDISAGQSAGVGRNILLLTGRGKDQLALWDRQHPKPFVVCPDLLSAITTWVHKPV